MPAPIRGTNWTLILTPSASSGSMRDALATGRQACRWAHHKRLVPIYPLIYCMGFMTEEEVNKDLAKQTMIWAKRASKIWVCMEPGEFEIDVVTHDILFFNEGHMGCRLRHYQAPSRLPVYKFWMRDNGDPMVEIVERQDVSALLRQNIMSGLFRGFIDGRDLDEEPMEAVL